MSSDQATSSMFKYKILDVQMQYIRKKAIKSRIKSFFMRPVHTIMELIHKKQTISTPVLRAVAEPRHRTLWERLNDINCDSAFTQSNNLRLPPRVLLRVTELPAFITQSKRRCKFWLAVCTAKHRYTVEMKLNAEIFLKLDSWDEELIIEVYSDFKLFGCTMPAFELANFVECCRLTFTESSIKESVGILTVSVPEKSLPDFRPVVNNNPFYSRMEVYHLSQEERIIMLKELPFFMEDDVAEAFLSLSTEVPSACHKSISSAEKDSCGSATEFSCSSQNTSQDSLEQSYTEQIKDTNNEESIYQQEKESALITQDSSSHIQKTAQHEKTSIKSLDDFLQAQLVALPIEDEICDSDIEDFSAVHTEKSSDVTFQAVQDISDVDEQKGDINCAVQVDEKIQSEAILVEKDQIIVEQSGLEAIGKSYASEAVEENASSSSVPNTNSKKAESNTEQQFTQQPKKAKTIYDLLYKQDDLLLEDADCIRKQLSNLMLLQQLPFFEAHDLLAQYNAFLTLSVFRELPYAQCQDRLFYPKSYKPSEWAPDDPNFWCSKPAPKTLTVQLSIPAIERHQRWLDNNALHSDNQITTQTTRSNFIAKHRSSKAYQPYSHLWYLFCAGENPWAFQLTAQQ